MSFMAKAAFRLFQVNDIAPDMTPWNTVMITEIALKSLKMNQSQERENNVTGN